MEKKREPVPKNIIPTKHIKQRRKISKKSKHARSQKERSKNLIIPSDDLT